MRSEWAISIRRACAAIRFDPTTYRYKSHRRVHVLLRREGWEVNPKRTYRIYRELGIGGSPLWPRSHITLPT